ncbi:MAG: type II toxin-antitoxin system HicA family toxin [Spirochaetia bacterium]
MQRSHCHDVNRKQCVQELVRAGCYLKRRGNRHDLYTNPLTRKSAPIPRHPEIKDSLCRLIRKQLDLVE